MSIIALLGYVVLTYLCYRIHPLKILRVKIMIFFPFMLLTPYLLNYINTPFELFFIQAFYVLFVLSTNPATSVFYTRIPIFKRFTYGSFIYALSRALMHITTSLGLVYLTRYLGNWGILIIMLPMCIGFAFGVEHFNSDKSGALSLKENTYCSCNKSSSWVTVWLISCVNSCSISGIPR